MSFRILFLHLMVASQSLGIIQADNQSGSYSPGLRGKVMCGYQAWFRCPSDGSAHGWRHYSTQDEFAPGKCSIEIWPDVRELPAHLRVKTPFKHQGGSVAEVYSSISAEAIDLHFKWMKDYEIDGVFLQRFAVSTTNRRLRDSLDHILECCQKSAQKHNRNLVLMYDLSGLKAGQVDVVINDWKHLHGKLKLVSSSYVSHNDKPLIALWGMGFRDRKTSLDEWERVIKFLQHDPEYGGNSIMVGIPSFWRSLSRDSVADSKLHEVIKITDIISPWTVGRYGTSDEAKKHAEQVVKSDIEWCKQQKIDYLPVIFPGFSWQNLMASRGKKATFNQIPRKRGQFLWSQAQHFHTAGAEMFYVAMFDELDEGTTIFKTRNDPPVGDSRFIAERGLPSDHYLWLTGQIRAEIQKPANNSRRIFPKTLPPRVHE